MQETKQKQECKCWYTEDGSPLPTKDQLDKQGMCKHGVKVDNHALETKQKEIREKWLKSKVCDIDFWVDDEVADRKIANWWISEFSTLLAERDAEVVEMIKKMRKVYKPDTGFIGLTSLECGYNQALDDITNKLDGK